MAGNRKPRSVPTKALRAVLVFAALTPNFPAQTDWPQYGRDPGGERYSPLTQIKPDNVAKLKPAWTWDPGEITLSFETTPLVIGNVMYVSTPRERVVALEADTGKELWSFDTKVAAPSTHRGVSYWPGDENSGAGGRGNIAGNNGGAAADLALWIRTTTRAISRHGGN
jgi:quinoprotein glucose dehydrogenase